MAATVLAFSCSFAIAHGGGLNAEGCHNNRKTGDYHCHRSPPPSASRSNDAPAGNAAPLQAAPSRSDSSGPTCYTGPRGGTYTITPSGRKNYSGC
ncbi:YHYH domain-containing protein [Ramlibacter terrae]|uniref:YHYH domain-containing protein n=1 Tax=Ramlibacter terrae TaxID=2732511 RepID=A0ABX6P6V0_9BURK|nr:YHYH domain-containing protein [Ramlibacter terrae]